MTNKMGAYFGPARSEIISDVETFNPGGDTQGVSVTGFLDIEKFIFIGGRFFFIEKKLPFQLLFISDDLNGMEPIAE